MSQQVRSKPTFPTLRASIEFCDEQIKYYREKKKRFKKDLLTMERKYCK